MNLQFYLEKLFGSEEFAKFKKEHKDCYLCGGFFVIDRENMKAPENKSHLDFFVPSDKRMFSFDLESGVQVLPVEQFDPERTPGKVKDNYNFEFEDIEDLIRKKMDEEKFSNKIQKIILTIQNAEGKDYILCTVFISGMGILKVHISLPDKKIVLFEKHSFFDMLKMVKGKKGEKKE
ncbi:Uncharacterised protein [uncultured archaeon]|nr:Uncharacterised protein [uncultured archaeon]